MREEHSDRIMEDDGGAGLALLALLRVRVLADGGFWKDFSHFWCLGCGGITQYGEGRAVDDSVAIASCSSCLDLEISAATVVPGSYLYAFRRVLRPFFQTPSTWTLGRTGADGGSHPKCWDSRRRGQCKSTGRLDSCEVGGWGLFGKPGHPAMGMIGGRQRYVAVWLVFFIARWTRLAHCY